LTVAHHSWLNGYGNAYNCRLAHLTVSNIVAPFFSSLHCLLQPVIIQFNLTPFPPQVQPRLNTTIHSWFYAPYLKEKHFPTTGASPEVAIPCLTPDSCRTHTTSHTCSVCVCVWMGLYISSITLCLPLASVSLLVAYLLPLLSLPLLKSCLPLCFCD
jgi:hypothetical protein